MMVRFFSLWHFAAVKSCCFLWIIAAQKRDLQLQNQTRESWKLAGSCGEKERNQTGRVVQRKRKEIRWGGVHAAKSYFIIRRGRFLSFMMIQFQTISFWFHLQLNPLFYHFSIQSLVQKNPSNQACELGLNPSRGRILYFYIRYSNWNILSFWYWNQVIQKPKFIYTSRTTTLMKDSKWDKIVLDNRIWQ